MGANEASFAADEESDEGRDMSDKTRWMLAGAALALSGCSSAPWTREPWVYALSRNAYPNDWISLPSSSCEVSHPCDALVLAAIFVAPFAIDTVLLPITVPHDLVYAK
jgi:hypothetical protein